MPWVMNIHPGQSLEGLWSVLHVGGEYKYLGKPFWLLGLFYGRAGGLIYCLSEPKHEV